MIRNLVQLNDKAIAKYLHVLFYHFKVLKSISSSSQILTTLLTLLYLRKDLMYSKCVIILEFGRLVKERKLKIKVLDSQVVD